MSARALCGDCGARRNKEAAEQLVNREGPFYDEWRYRLVEFAETLTRT